MAHDPYKYFRIEARELVDQLGKATLELERGASPEVVARLLRVAHTLKGAARVVKQREIADRAHALEDALTPLRGATSPVPRERIDRLLSLVDEMSARVTSLGAVPGAETVAAGRSSPEEPVRALHADVAEMDELLDGITELHAQLAPARRSLGIVERGKRLVELIVDQLAAPQTPAQRIAGGEKTRSMVEDLGALLVGLERSLSMGVEQTERELTQVRRAAEQMRLMPARVMFNALERSARDAAQALGKRVIFEARGGDVRLDAQVLGAVQGALVQIVRNAIAHGIESEDHREAAGKRRVGCVTLDVVRRGRFVTFLGKDDGRGVDLQAVRNLVQQRGLLSTEARALGTGDLLALLLKGGLSTSPSVTEVSGRGVGLDVVRETVERLSGEVNVRTTPGEGTTVELIVPVSVASVPGLVVDAAGMSVTIPLDAVVKTLRVDANQVARTAEGDVVISDGVAVPFLPLAGVLSSRRAPARGARAWSAVVVRGATGVAVVGVDRLLGTANVVLRPLPELAPASTIVAGASLDAEGSPRLVLDPDSLVLAARQRVDAERESAVRRAPILVIDDSLTTRMLERSILESAGYEVEVATSGEEGFERARARRYALFLVDIEMPGMDGFTFIERTRADPALRDIPAILVSSRASPEDRLRGQEVGAIDYMIKSEFDQGALLARIREQVG
jgi:two-component system, chemotaxis family, sensor kinase CheA